MASKNPYLKKAHSQSEMTPEQVMELKRCIADPVHFIKTYVRVQHPTKGSIPFDLYPYQVEMVRNFQRGRYNIVLSARQTGKSATSAAYLLWFATFNFDKTILIASNKNSNAMEMIQRIRYAYENLPHWIKAGIMDDGWNKHSVEFDNGSRIISTATSEEAGRGMSISLLFLDEFAFVKPGIQDEFWTSIAPTLSTGGSCIMSSTPNGDSNIFSQIWRGAEVGANGFIPTRVHWDEPPGRDAKFKDEEVAKIGQRRWEQEYECIFLSSDALLIESIVIQNLSEIVKKISPTKSVKDVTLWEEPKEDATYVIGVDPATGSGEDFTVIEVFHFPSLRQVAEFRSNTMSHPIAYNILKNIIKYYESKNCQVYFSVENNGVGQGIIALFEADEQPPSMAEMVSDEGKDKLGVVTTPRSKMRGCVNLKNLLESDKMTLQSRITVSELKSYIRYKGAYAAQRGSTDDCISAILIVLRILEEIAQFEDAAYNKLYSAETEDWEEDDFQDYDESEEGMPMVF